MRNIFRNLKKKDVGSIGIGAMIVFIAMVLVAGIAASVLIQTSTTLESQAMATGRETTEEVAGGIAVFDIEGHVTTDIDALAVTVRARAGSPDIDLNETIVLLTDGTFKSLLTYDFTTATHFNSSVDTSDGDVFGFDYGTLTNEQFGILVLEDADNSVKRYTPVLNTGDKVMLFINGIATFGGTGLTERKDVNGWIYPEHGSPGVIAFRTPASYFDTVYDLQ
ncbi:MAG: flagellin [Thermoplasmatales archaeon]|nr:MAG: flagellin [Thermoplasmatales archaeon]